MNLDRWLNLYLEVFSLRNKLSRTRPNSKVTVHNASIGCFKHSTSKPPEPKQTNVQPVSNSTLWNVRVPITEEIIVVPPEKLSASAEWCVECASLFKLRAYSALESGLNGWKYGEVAIL